MVRSLHIAASVASRDGGTATAILNSARALNDLAHSALVLATTADGPHESIDRSTRATVMEAGCPVWFCRRARPHSLKNSWRLAARAIRLARQHDIVHVHGVYLAHDIWAYLACRIGRVPYVLQPHGVLEPYQERQSPRRKRIYNRLIGTRIVKGAAALIATSDVEASHLVNAFPQARVETVPLGAEPPNETSAVAQLNLCEIPRTSLVLFLGRLARKKRLDVLVDAWNRVEADAHLVIGGPEEDWAWSELATRISQERLPSVTYLGNLPIAEAAWLCDQAGLLVLPSENENFGLVVPEAMTHGCAVLTTPQVATSEYVTKANGGLVLEDLDADSLAAALDDLLADPDELSGMGHAARIFAQRELTWAASAHRLTTVYGRYARHIGN